MKPWYYYLAYSARRPVTSASDTLLSLASDRAQGSCHILEGAGASVFDGRGSPVRLDHYRQAVFSSIERDFRGDQADVECGGVSNDSRWALETWLTGHVPVSPSLDVGRLDRDSRVRVSSFVTNSSGTLDLGRRSILVFKPFGENPEAMRQYPAVLAQGSSAGVNPRFSLGANCNWDKQLRWDEILPSGDYGQFQSTKVIEWEEFRAGFEDDLRLFVRHYARSETGTTPFPCRPDGAP